MKWLAKTGCVLLALFVGREFLPLTSVLGQERSAAVSIVELLANQDRFDGKLVTLVGFLTIDTQKKHAAMAFLHLHEEDAKHLLPNGLEVVPSQQMLRDQEKINGMYVVITGLLHIVPNENGSHGIVMKDVRSCKLWSDPRRPITSRDVQLPAKK